MQYGSVPAGSGAALLNWDDVKHSIGQNPAEAQQAKLTALQAEISAGIEQAEQGNFVEFTAEEIIAEGKARRSRRKWKPSRWL